MRKIPRAVFNDERRGRENVWLLSDEFERRAFREIPLRAHMAPYRKPPLVDEARSLRGTGDLPLRNSTKKLGVTSG